MLICASEFQGLAGVGADAGGDFVQSAKSKKERLRKLSALGTASSSFQDCEMGCDVSDREDELPSKRFKLPKKVGYSLPNLRPHRVMLIYVSSLFRFSTFFLFLIFVSSFLMTAMALIMPLFRGSCDQVCGF